MPVAGAPEEPMTSDISSRTYSRPAATLVFEVAPHDPIAARILDVCLEGAAEDPSWPAKPDPRRPGRAVVITSRRYGVRSEALDDHVRWAIERASRVAAEIQELKGRGIASRLVCMWFSEAGHGGEEFHPEVLAKLSALGLSLGVDVYSVRVGRQKPDD